MFILSITVVLLILSPQDFAYKLGHIPYILYIANKFLKNQKLVKLFLIARYVLKSIFVLKPIAISGDKIFLKCIFIVFFVVTI